MPMTVWQRILLVSYLLTFATSTRRVLKQPNNPNNPRELKPMRLIRYDLPSQVLGGLFDVK